MRPIIWQVVGVFVIALIVYILYQYAEIKALEAENNKMRLAKKL